MRRTGMDSGVWLRRGSMGILLALASAFGYAVDATLMARHYRQFDALGGVALRGVALAITGTPILLLVDPGAFALLPEYLPHLIAAGATATAANWAYARATDLLPVGVANAGVMALQVVAVSVLAFWVFGEALSLVGWALATAIVAVNVSLVSGRYTSSHALARAPVAGFMYTATSGIAQSGTFIVIAVVARKVDPFLAAYLIEVSAGACALAALGIRTRLVGKPPGPPMAERLPAVAAHSFASVPALACYAWAVTRTDVAVVQAAFTSVALFASLLGVAVWRERLTARQITTLFVVVALVSVLELTSS